MTLRTSALSALFLGLVAGPLAACGDKSEEEEEEEADADTDADTDSDTDSDTDADTDTDTDVDYFEPDWMLAYADGAIINGELGQWSYDGTAADFYFIVTLADSEEWEGTLEDTRNTCQLYYVMDETNSTLESSFVDAGAWQGWVMNSAADAYLGSAGACEDMDPDIWGEDVSEWVNSYQWGWGPGPLDEDVATVIQENYPDAWADNEDLYIGGYVYTDYAGSADIYPFLLGWALELDAENGNEMVVDDEGNVSYLSGAAFSYAEDARYYTVPLYLWQL